MIFETIYKSSRVKELILLDGGYCRWHLRKDGQLTIYEIIATQPGVGEKMLQMLKGKKPKSIFAKCPAYLPSNSWYRNRGFVCERQEVTSTGTTVNCWRLSLS